MPGSWSNLAEQYAPGELTLHVTVGDGAVFGDVAAQLERSVRSALAGYGCHATAVSVHDGIETLPAGVKRRRVICRWKRDDARAMVAS